MGKREQSHSPARMRRERKTLYAMIRLYCRRQHGRGGELCEECGNLRLYARHRLERCPFQEGKTTCARCPVHCYRPEMRERIREVMAYAGPRMLTRHPLLALLHLLDGRRAEPRPAAERRRPGGPGGVDALSSPASSSEKGEHALEPKNTPGRPGSRLKLIVLAAVVVAAVAALQLFDVQATLRRALAWVRDLGPLGPLIFIGIYVLATVLFIPGSLLTLGAGVVFGVLEGSVIVSIAATLGATAAFLVGRYFARGWVARKIEGNEKFKAIDDAVAREGWKIVGLTRLSPVFPFNLLNYAYGLTKVTLRDYFLASWIGMLPGTVMYVYIGSLAGSLAMLGASGRTRTTGEWVLYGVGLVATVVVTVYVTRLARAALARRV